ncbi:MAG TPA: methyltransferase domain-containing protein [Desulfosporosinus sp.]
MSLDNVRKHFEEEAFDYDGLISRIIPKYHEQNETVLAMIPFDGSRNIKALDLGCGTGILSHLLLSTFPKAKVVAFDLAENMLAACEQNLSEYKDQLTLVNGNFASDDFGRDYDIVVSGLSTHHLGDKEKPLLYKRIYDSINRGGIFINREVVLGESSSLSDRYHQLWREYTRSNDEDEEKWFKKYLEEDIPAPVDIQTNWLREIGFVDVGCHWRYFNFAIFGGIKP